MSEPFTGQILLFGFNFPPRSFSYCNGSSVLAYQNPALYSLLGATFGGSGSGTQLTFKLPNLTGLVVGGTGVSSAPNSTINWTTGMTKGVESVTLNGNTYPTHTHTLSQQSVVSTEGAPIAGHSISSILQAKGAAPLSAADTTLAANFLSTAGVASPTAHENCQASLALNICICLDGEYPYFP